MNPDPATNSNFKVTISSFLLGLLFGLGLIIAGMADPAKVLAFLDLAGLWDPSLALVLFGAIGVTAPIFFFAKRRTQSLLHVPLALPTVTKLDKRLIFGSMTFGIGWGVVGVCPGPALVLLGTGSMAAVWFFAALVAGMLAFDLIEKQRQQQRQQQPEPQRANQAAQGASK